MNTPQEAYDLLKTMLALEKNQKIEHMYVICLDSADKVITAGKVFSGGKFDIDFPVKDLFRTAVKMNAARIVIGHNHPSGQATPSPEDVDATQKIAQGGEILGIDVVDHLVFTPEAFFSFKLGGLL